MKRPVLLIFLACGICSGPSHAQSTSIAAAFGSMNYDAGGDDAYELIRFEITRSVSSALRLGVGAARVDVGSRNLGFVVPDWRSGREIISRIYGTASIELQDLLAKSTTPVLNRIVPWFQLNAGLVNLSGRTILTPQNAPPEFNEHTNTTGPSLGAGVGLNLRIVRHLSLQGGVTAWQDFILGGRKSDFNRFAGAVLRF